MGRLEEEPVKGQLPKAYLRIDPNIDQTHAEPLAMLRLLCAANRQTWRGRFKNRAVLEGLFGRAMVRRMADRGDIEEGEFGRWYVTHWDEWQEGDHTVGDRMRRLRASREASSTRKLTVTAPSPDSNPPSEASRRLGVKASTNGPPTPQRGRLTVREPLLTKRQLVSWESFGPEWAAFKTAWIGRGLLFSPYGAPDDDETSQRGMLYRILDARPNDIVDWVKEAPPRKQPTSREVIGYILERWHRIQDEAMERPVEPVVHGPSRREAPEALSAILRRTVQVERPA